MRVKIKSPLMEAERECHSDREALRFLKAIKRIHDYMCVQKTIVTNKYYVKRKDSHGNWIWFAPGEYIRIKIKKLPQKITMEVCHGL